MNYADMRKELRSYYPKISDKKADDFREHCYKILNEKSKGITNPYKLKALQYKVITEEFEPVIFENCPFYYEMGTIHALSDGARNFRGMRHAGGWLYDRNQHLYEEYDKELYEYERPVHTLDAFTEKQYEAKTCTELLDILETLKAETDVSLRFLNMREQKTDCCKKIAEEILG